MWYFTGSKSLSEERGLVSAEDVQISAVRVFPDALLLVDPLPSKLLIRRGVEVVRDISNELLLLLLWQDRDVGLGKNAIDDSLQRRWNSAVVVPWLIRLKVAGEGRSFVHRVPVHVPVLRSVVFEFFVDVSDLGYPWCRISVFEVPDESEDTLGRKALATC